MFFFYCFCSFRDGAYVKVDVVMINPRDLKTAELRRGIKENENELLCELALPLPPSLSEPYVSTIISLSLQ